MAYLRLLDPRHRAHGTVGPVLGVWLLLLTDRSLNFINVAGALVYTITVPYAAIALTLYYFDLEGAARPSVSLRRRGDRLGRRDGGSGRDDQNNRRERQEDTEGGHCE